MSAQAAPTPPRKSGLGFRDRMSELTERLLDPLENHDETKPSFTITFSMVQVLRLPILPLSIADCVLMSKTHDHVFWAVFFGSWTIAHFIWNAYQMVGFRSNKFEFRVGSFVCWLGRVNTDGSLARKQRPYMAMVTDFVFCCLFIIPSVLAFKTDIWRSYYYWDDDLHTQVGALTITLASLSLVHVVTNFFSIFRKAKVVVYATEFEEKADYLGELYIDDRSEPRTSMASVGSMASPSLV
ncbi:hypothetical protein AK830_g11825 [Neonectria ditissima]|uniref:Uncharacterized protein n=1 Tax=Neonectria ditissima TaxID=78410 RepID=A0A0P7B6V4_9HYPO|nr:hypothetical protein AK830_g11825 [Neonectria ditissima]